MILSIVYLLSCNYFHFIFESKMSFKNGQNILLLGKLFTVWAEL